MNLHGVVEGGQALGDAGAERGRVAHHAVGHFAAAQDDRILELLQARDQDFLDRLALGGDRGRHRVGGFLQRFDRLDSARGNGVPDLVADVIEVVGGLLALVQEVLDDFVAGTGDVGARRMRLRDEIVDDAVGRIGDRGVDAVADAVDVEMEGLLNAGDRLLQAERVRQNRVAFALQAFD